MNSSVWVIIVTSMILIQPFGLVTSTETITGPHVEITSTLDTNNFQYKLNYTYPRLAFVKPFFTAAAYSKYYSFYICYNANTCNATVGESYLQRPPIDAWSTSSPSANLIDKLHEAGFPSNKLTVINDIKVHNNELYFNNGSRKYDTLFFFHNEYVTMSEYHNMVNFIKNGGNVLVMNGNGFFGEVDYDPIRNLVIIVDAHGFVFDGQNGTKSLSYYRFLLDSKGRENAKWLGSSYCAFNEGGTQGAVFQTDNTNPHPVALDMVAEGIPRIVPSYSSHEENCVDSPNSHTIADWQTGFRARYRGIKIYETFPEGPFGGSLVHFGFFGSYYYNTNPELIKTIKEVVLHQMGDVVDPWIRYPADGSVLNDQQIVFDYTTGYKTTTYLNGSQVAIKPKDSLALPEGTYNFTVTYQLGQKITKRSVVFSVDRTPPVPVIEYTSDGTKLNELILKMDDKHPEFVTGTWLLDTKGMYYAYNGSNGIDPVQIRMSGFQAFNTFKNDTFIIRVEATDSAGNTAEKWFTFNLGQPKTPYYDLKSVQPKFIKMNTTTGYVDIPKLPENKTAFLDISTDFGQNWSRVSFENYNNGTDRAYAKRTSDSIWYRVGLLEKNKFLLYYPEIRSYYWDSTIISTKSIISNYSNQILDTNITIGLEQYQNISVSAELVTGSNQTIPLSLHNSMITSSDNLTSNYEFMFNGILESGLNKIRYTISTGETTMIRETELWIPSSQVNESITKLAGGVYNVDIQGLKQKGVVMLRLNNSASTILSIRLIKDMQLVAENGSILLEGYNRDGDKIYQLTVKFNDQIDAPRLVVNDLGNTTKSNYDTIYSYYISSNRPWTLTTSIDGGNGSTLAFSQNAYINVSITQITHNITISLRFSNGGSTTQKSIIINIIEDTRTTLNPPTTPIANQTVNSNTSAPLSITLTTTKKSVVNIMSISIALLVIPIIYNKYRYKKLRNINRI